MPCPLALPLGDTGSQRLAFYPAPTLKRCRGNGTTPQPLYEKQDSAAPSTAKCNAPTDDHCAVARRFPHMLLRLPALYSTPVRQH